MKKITSKNDLSLLCATLVLFLVGMTHAMGDPQLSVAVSSSTPAVVYLADGADTVTVTLTATPTLTSNAGELIEHEEGDCGTTDYTYEWSPTPNISIGNGATYTLTEGIHVFNVTVTAVNLCIAQIGGGNAIVEVKKKCNEKKSNVTRDVAVEIPDITDVTNKLKTIIKRLPKCSDANFTITGGFRAIQGEMCCAGTEDTDADPVVYKNINGTVAVSPSIQFLISGFNAGFNDGLDTPVRWRANVSCIVGPTVTVSASGNLGVSGQISDCGTCLTSNIGISGQLELAFQASVQGNFEIFEEGNWLHVSSNFNFLAKAYGETGFSGQCSLTHGNGCPQQGTVASANIGSLVAGIEFSTTYNGVPFKYNINKTIFNGISLTD